MQIDTTTKEEKEKTKQALHKEENSKPKKRVRFNVFESSEDDHKRRGSSRFIKQL